MTDRQWATSKERGAILKLIRERDGSLACHWCGKSPRRSIDHIVSRSNGGTNAPWNLVASCVECNSERGNDDDPEHCVFCRRAHEQHNGTQQKENGANIHRMWYPMFDEPITITLSRKQLQSIADELRGINVYPGWAEQFARGLDNLLEES